MRGMECRAFARMLREILWRLTELVFKVPKLVRVPKAEQETRATCCDKPFSIRLSWKRLAESFFASAVTQSWPQLLIKSLIRLMILHL